MRQHQRPLLSGLLHLCSPVSQPCLLGIHIDSPETCTQGRMRLLTECLMKEVIERVEGGRLRFLSSIFPSHEKKNPNKSVSVLM